MLCSHISQYSGVHRTFDSGAMAKVSDGYTIGSVATCIREVITCKRMLQLRVKPLTHVELINALRFLLLYPSICFRSNLFLNPIIDLFSAQKSQFIVRKKRLSIHGGQKHHWDV